MLNTKISINLKFPD